MSYKSKSRKAFEEWFEVFLMPIETIAWKKLDEDGDYIDREAQDCWTGWKARDHELAASNAIAAEQRGAHERAAHMVRELQAELATANARVAELEQQVQRGLSVVTAAVYLCNGDATHDRHMFLFSLDQALMDNGFKQR